MSADRPVIHDWDLDRLDGMEVHDADDVKLGRVDQVLRSAHDPSRHFLLVRAVTPDGIDELYVPQDAIALLGEDRIVLTRTEADLRRRDGTHHC